MFMTNMKCKELTILVYYSVTLDTFQPSLKKINPVKSLTFQEMELSGHKIKRFLKFFQKSLFLYFAPGKNLL